MLYLLLCVGALGSAFAQEVTMRHGFNIRLSRNQNGYVLSPGFSGGQPAPNGFAGVVTIQAPQASNRIRLDFEDFDLETSNQCSADRVNIVEGSQRKLTLCSNRRPKPYLSRGSSVTIEFITDDLKKSRGFRIRFRTTNNRTLCHSTREYQCSTRECIPSSRLCDGHFDCADASDEVLCRRTTWRRHLSDAPCGAPAIEPVTEPEDRIVGGASAVPHSWPWQVTMQIKGVEPVGHFCGGALIANNFVVTAAHCIMGRRPDDILVKAGGHNLRDDDTTQWRDVEVMASHNSFAVSDMTHDVAVLKLSVPVNFTDHVRPVCFPSAHDTLPTGTVCFSTGWGNTRGTGNSFSLKQTRLTVRNFSDCENVLQVQPNLQGDHVVCAADESNVSGPCHGDSGGPLVCQHGNGGNWTLYGSTSMAVDITMSGTICGMGSSTVWSSLLSNRNWVVRALRNL